MGTQGGRRALPGDYTAGVEKKYHYAQPSPPAAIAAKKQIPISCFAGSGSFGFEALSRGAKEVHAVEMGPLALKALKTNCQSLGCQKRHLVHARPLPQAAESIPLCDIIFADPPFPWFREQPAVLGDVLEALVLRLAPDGELIVRGERGEMLPPVANANTQQRREYGRSWIEWLTKAD